MSNRVRSSYVDAFNIRSMYVLFPSLKTMVDSKASSLSSGAASLVPVDLSKRGDSKKGKLMKGRQELDAC